LVINTGTTIVTFLMVFLIQNTQNRDSHAVQLKLDELIRTVSVSTVTVIVDIIMRVRGWNSDQQDWRFARVRLGLQR
jgi:low affinity Fe/Cu permease